MVFLQLFWWMNDSVERQETWASSRIITNFEIKCFLIRIIKLNKKMSNLRFNSHWWQWDFYHLINIRKISWQTDLHQYGQTINPTENFIWLKFLKTKISETYFKHITEINYPFRSCNCKHLFIKLFIKSLVTVLMGVFWGN